MSEIDNGEVSFRELVESTKGYINEIVKNWLIVFLISIPLIAYFYFVHKTFKVNYVAETKFVVEGGSALGSGIGGLLGQIGLRGGGNGKFNNFKILEVARSKKILSAILFNKQDGEYIANLLIQKYELNKKWGKTKPEFLDFKFKNDSAEKFTKTESAAYNGLIGLITGGKKAKEPLLSVNYDEDRGIYTIYSNVRDEALTLKMAELNYERLKHFFENELVESQIKTTAILKFKADSINALIKLKTSQIAAIQDRTYGLILASPTIQRSALEKEILGLVAAHSEFIKSYEMADIGLKDIRASFIKLDDTIGPLEPIESSLILSIIKALSLAVLIGSIFISLRKLYREAM